MLPPICPPFVGGAIRRPGGPFLFRSTSSGSAFSRPTGKTVTILAGGVQVQVGRTLALVNRIAWRGSLAGQSGPPCSDRSDQLRNQYAGYLFVRMRRSLRFRERAALWKAQEGVEKTRCFPSSGSRSIQSSASHLPRMAVSTSTVQTRARARSAPRTTWAGPVANRLSRGWVISTIGPVSATVR